MRAPSSDCPAAAGECSWTGDADLGNDCRQPGGWIYNVLPYIDQQALHDMGTGLPTALKYAAHQRRNAVAIPILYCPTRHPPVSFSSWFIRERPPFRHL